MLIYTQHIHPESNYDADILVANFLISMSELISFTVIKGSVKVLICLVYARCNHVKSLEESVSGCGPHPAVV